MHRISELKGNNEAVFRDIFNEYQYPLYRFLYQKIDSEFYAKEVVQLTFIKLWKYRQQLDPDLDISIQLFRIARTTLIDEIRKLQTRERHYYNYGASPAGKSIPDESTTHLISYRETKAKLFRLINMLPPKRREVFKLSRIHCHTNNEIASMLSISPKTVEHHLTHALRFMRPFFSLLIIFYILVG